MATKKEVTAVVQVQAVADMAAQKEQVKAVEQLVQAAPISADLIKAIVETLTKYAEQHKATPYASSGGFSKDLRADLLALAHRFYPTPCHGYVIARAIGLGFLSALSNDIDAKKNMSKADALTEVFAWWLTGAKFQTSDFRVSAVKVSTTVGKTTKAKGGFFMGFDRFALLGAMRDVSAVDDKRVQAALDKISSFDDATLARFLNERMVADRAILIETDDVVVDGTVIKGRKKSVVSRAIAYLNERAEREQKAREQEQDAIFAELNDI